MVKKDYLYLKVRDSDNFIEYTRTERTYEEETGYTVYKIDDAPYNAGGSYDGTTYTPEAAGDNNLDAWSWAIKAYAESGTLIGHTMCDRCLGMGTKDYMNEGCWSALNAAYDAR